MEQPKRWGFVCARLVPIHSGRSEVGFKLSVPCSGERLDSRIHQNDGRLSNSSAFFDNYSVSADSQALLEQWGVDKNPLRPKRFPEHLQR